MKKSQIHNGFSVLIKRDANIKFPKLCVVCGKACEAQQTQISGTNEQAISFLHGYLIKKPKLSIPIHYACENFWQKIDKRRGFIHSMVLLLSAGTIYSINKSIDNWLIFLPLISVIIFDKFVLNHFWYTEPLFFSADKKRYRFIFKDKTYAELFEKANSKYIHKERILGDFGA